MIKRLIFKNKTHFLSNDILYPKKIQNGCASADNGTTMTNINPQVSDGTKFEFDQFAFVSTSPGIPII